MFNLKKNYLLLALLLFITEVLIALFAHDKIIRPYIGDFLAAILVYCSLRAVLNISLFTASVSTLLFCCGVETLQYFHIVEKLGLAGSSLARTAIGSSFEWKDLFLYTAGMFAVVIVELYKKYTILEKKKTSQ